MRLLKTRILPVCFALLLLASAWCYRALLFPPPPASAPASPAATVAVPAKPAAPVAPPAQPAPPPAEPTLADQRFPSAGRTLPADLSAAAQAARTGILIDLSERKTLWEKAADEPVEIASMTKMMTALLLLRAVQDEKRIRLEDPVTVSKTAAGMGGSQVWLEAGETFPLEELARCMMVKSANDAALAIAEAVAGGSGEAFVDAMNAQARRYGLAGMVFYNVHGLPPDKARRQPENAGSARELAFVASRLLEYPDAIRWASMKEGRLAHRNGRVVEYENHNSLVGFPGVTGMKTGYTAKSMYCTTVTCTRDGRTLIAVVTGCPRGRPYGGIRDNLVRRLLDWGYGK